jgi:hypothetical protein
VIGWLPLRAESIPADLRALGWVLWRAEPRGDDKPAKVPYCVAEPMRRASSTDTGTWAPFGDAVEAYGVLAAQAADPVRGPVAGIGVVLTAPAGVTCVDLDRVIGSDGALDARAQTIVERCDSWTEISPSGSGLHIFVRGTLGQALKGLQIEVYSTARYIAVTGHHWAATPAGLRYQQAYLDHLARAAGGTGARRHPWTGRAVPPPDDLAGALLAKLEGWGLPAAHVKRWSDGYLVELPACPWADEHTTGRGGAAVMIHASGAYDFTCLHAHCAGRTWRDLRAAMEQR